MTDNRTTELRISEPLRGFIRHQSNRAYIDGGQARWLTEIADEIDAKHEQAIAATLGRDKPPYDELLRCLENDWNIRASWDGLRKFWNIELTEEGVRLRDATHGTLTAEQVRRIIMDCSRRGWAGDDDCWHIEGEPQHWQRMADELNARAERTCKSTTDDNAWCFVCSECGKSFPRSNLHLAHNHGEVNYCPNCGCKVVDAREEVVRCRDCKHFTPKGTHKFENGKVNADYCKYVRGYMLQITPDGFCAWGERKEA